MSEKCDSLFQWNGRSLSVLERVKGREGKTARDVQVWKTLAKVRLARWLGLALRQSRKNSAKSRGIRNNRRLLRALSTPGESQTKDEKQNNRPPTSKIEKCNSPAPCTDYPLAGQRASALQLLVT